VEWWRRWSRRGQIGESAVEALLVENATSIRHPPHRTNRVSAIGEADAPPPLSLSLSYFRLGSRVVPSVPRPRNYIPWALGVPRSSTIRAFVVHTSLADEDPMLFHVHILGEQYSRWKCTSRARPSLRPCRSVVQTCTPSNDAIVACQVYGVPAVLSSRARAQSCLEKKWSRSREFSGKHREYRGRNIPRKTRVSRVGIGYFDHAIVQAKTSPKDRE